MYFKFHISNLRFAVAVLSAILLLTGCGKKSEPVEVKTDETATMRVVAMAPNLTEILFALGLDEEIVGVTKNSTYPQQAKAKQGVGSFWQPDIEAILRLQPTLVVTLSFDQQAAMATRLERIGCEVLTVEIESIAELYAAIETIGQAVNRQAEAKAILGRLHVKQQQIIEQSVASEKPKVLWVIQREPLRVAGTTTYVNELIEIAGGVNAIGETLQIYPPISTENVIRAMPDIIIEPSMDPDRFEKQKATAKEFFSRFAMTPAVKNNRVYVIDGDLVSRLSPRLDQSMELVHQCIAPKEDN